MRSRRRLILSLMVGWLLQYAVVPHIAIGKATPDILLIVVAIFSFLDGPIAGSLAGFASGVLVDFVAGQVTGIQVFSRTITGYLSGTLERTVFGSTVLLVGAVMFFVSIASQVIYVLVAFVFGEAIEFAAAGRSVILPSALYTSLMSMVVFKKLSAFLGSERQETVFK